MGRFKVTTLHDNDGDDDDDEVSDENGHWRDFAGRDNAIAARDPLSATATSRTHGSQRSLHREDWPRRETAVPYHYWEGESKRPPRNYKLLYLSLWIGLVALYWQNDPPPAPPPQPSSRDYDKDSPSPPTTQMVNWTEYMRQHGQQLTQSATALGIHTPWHIVSWLGTSIVTDVQLLGEKIVRHIRQRHCASSSFVLHVPLDLQNRLQEAVVGQPLAVEWLADAVHVWQSHRTRSTAAHTPALPPPLVVFATGHAHTGKRTLAHALASNIVQRPNNNNNTVTFHKFVCTKVTTATAAAPDHTQRSAVLQLAGLDWKLNSAAPIDDDADSATASAVVATNRLFRKLVQAIQSFLTMNQIASSSYSNNSSSGSAVIIVTNVEDMEPSILTRLLVALSNKPDNQINNDSSLPNLHELAQNCVFYLTSSSIGLAPITRSLRATRGNLLNAVGSLPGDLNDAVQRQLGTIAAMEAIATILPFGPSTPAMLANVLRNKVALYSARRAAATDACWRRLIVTDAAVAAFLDESRVEYLEWRFSSASQQQQQRTDEEPAMLKVAVEGAKVLDDSGPIMTKIFAQVNQLLLQTTTAPLHHCDRVAVLDYDDSTLSSLLNTNRGFLQWCSDEQLQNCVETRRFRI